MAFTLYNAPQSTCSQRVRFVLNAKGLAFDEIKLNLLEGDQLKPDYLRMNPNGVVPTLDHDGNIVIDSNVIAEYLDEVEPAQSFTPEDPVRRARMRSLMHFIDEMPAAQPISGLPEIGKKIATKSAIADLVGGCRPSTSPSCRALPP
jgi:glutathione S-transferase